MHLKKGQIPLLIVNLCALAGFGAYFLVKGNYEFLIYVSVIIFFLIVIATTDKKVNYPNGALWGLTVWALLHMAGGAVYLRGVRLYEIILVPLSKTYPIFRYDQFVHVVGFGVATYIMFWLLKPLLRPGLSKWTALSIVVVMAGLGVGGLNEVVEFLVSVALPQTGVGDYANTGLDLVSDLVGSLLALLFIRLEKSRLPVEPCQRFSVNC